MNHAETMNRIYRFQRHLYDLTRPLFLFGRDELLCTIEIPAGGRVLEIGCGTARNLIKLARAHSDAAFYGVDISSEMLCTAQKKVDAAGLSDRITLKRCGAESMDPYTTFGLQSSFNVIFCSYTLSMMPAPDAALDAARNALAENGGFYAVDFWDGNGWPKPVKSALVNWLALFHVQFDTGIEELVLARFQHTQIRAVKGRYAFLAHPR